MSSDGELKSDLVRQLEITLGIAEAAGAQLVTLLLKMALKATEEGSQGHITN